MSEFVVFSCWERDWEVVQQCTGLPRSGLLVSAGWPRLQFRRGGGQ